MFKKIKSVYIENAVNMSLVIDEEINVKNKYSGDILVAPEHLKSIKTRKEGNKIVIDCIDMPLDGRLMLSYKHLKEVYVYNSDNVLIENYKNKSKKIDFYFKDSSVVFDKMTRHEVEVSLFDSHCKFQNTLLDKDFVLNLKNSIVEFSGFNVLDKFWFYPDKKSRYVFSDQTYLMKMAFTSEKIDYINDINCFEVKSENIIFEEMKKEAEDFEVKFHNDILNQTFSEDEYKAIYDRAMNSLRINLNNSLNIAEHNIKDSMKIVLKELRKEGLDDESEEHLNKVQKKIEFLDNLIPNLKNDIEKLRGLEFFKEQEDKASLLNRNIKEFFQKFELFHNRIEEAANNEIALHKEDSQRINDQNKLRELLNFDHPYEKISDDNREYYIGLIKSAFDYELNYTDKEIKNINKLYELYGLGEVKKSIAKF